VRAASIAGIGAGRSRGLVDGGWESGICDGSPKQVGTVQLGERGTAGRRDAGRNGRSTSVLYRMNPIRSYIQSFSQKGIASTTMPGHADRANPIGQSRTLWWTGGSVRGNYQTKPIPLGGGEGAVLWRLRETTKRSQSLRRQSPQCGARLPNEAIAPTLRACGRSCSLCRPGGGGCCLRWRTMMSATMAAAKTAIGQSSARRPPFSAAKDARKARPAVMLPRGDVSGGPR